MHTSRIANTAASLSGVVTNLNIKESSRTKLSAKVSTFFADLLLGNLFYKRNRYKSLKIWTTEVAYFNFFDGKGKMHTL